MLDVHLCYCNISSFLYTRPGCWATDKAIDPMFQLRAFNFVFYFFLQHGMSHSLASVTAGKKTSKKIKQYIITNSCKTTQTGFSYPLNSWNAQISIRNLCFKDFHL